MYLRIIEPKYLSECQLGQANNHTQRTAGHKATTCTNNKTKNKKQYQHYHTLPTYTC